MLPEKFLGKAVVFIDKLFKLLLFHLLLRRVVSYCMEPYRLLYCPLHLSLSVPVPLKGVFIQFEQPPGASKHALRNHTLPVVSRTTAWQDRLRLVVRCVGMSRLPPLYLTVVSLPAHACFGTNMGWN
jgi:hypothetical protein